MYSRKKKKEMKIYYICLTVVLTLLLIVSLLISREGNHKYNVLKNVSMTIDKIIMYPFNALNQDKGKKQSESELIQVNKNKELESEIQELKEALELNKTLTEYEPVNATVLSRNRSYWFNTMTIDKGSKSGIEENMSVITKNGFIGKITKVYANASEVKLITSDDLNFKVSVAIRSNGIDYYAIMNGYDAEKGYIKVSGIDKTTVINKGDIVVTSGLGEMFPAGIYVGEVEEITSDKYNLSKTLSIKTKQNFHNIHYVTVLKVKE